MDYDELSNGSTFRDILSGAVENYRRITTDSAAVSFAMGIHALLDYECDLEHAGLSKDEKMMQDLRLLAVIRHRMKL
ncbi:MAG: hypothetical protein IJ733_00610 [Lachnospiraceae bacterium]|nr:hypothetical protein [Lachnospiraceae bacterium]